MTVIKTTKATAPKTWMKESNADGWRGAGSGWLAAAAMMDVLIIDQHHFFLLRVGGHAVVQRHAPAFHLERGRAVLLIRQ